MNAMLQRRALVVVIASASVSVAASPTREPDVGAAFATVVSDWLSRPSDDLLSSVRAGDLNDLAAQLGVETATARLQRSSACLRTQVEVPALLKKLRDDALTELGGRPAKGVTLAAVEPVLWESVRDVVQVQLDPTSEVLRIVARGVGAAEGEEWTIADTGPATRTRRGCDKDGAPSQSAPPTEDALVRALATLSKTVRPQATRPVDMTTLTRVVLGVVGATDVQYATDAQRSRLKVLAKRVRTAGGDLVPLLQPQFDALEQRHCEGLQEQVSDRLSALLISEMQGDPVHLPETVGSYVIDRLGTWTPTTHHDFIARGTGPMKGDVWTTEHGYPVAKTDFCATRKAPSILK